MADPSEDKYRFSCLASAVVGLLCYALSSNSLLDLFGKWNFLKIFHYSVFSFIFCLVIWFAKTLQNLTSLRIKEHSPYLVFIVTTVYSFYFDEVNKKPDAYSVISRAAFAIMSLFSSRRTDMGCEVDLLNFFCTDLTLQLMKIEFPLVIVGVAFYLLIYLLKIDAPADYICWYFSPLSIAARLIIMRLRLSSDNLSWNLLKIFVYIAHGYFFYFMANFLVMNLSNWTKLSLRLKAKLVFQVFVEVLFMPITYCNFTTNEFETNCYFTINEFETKPNGEREFLSHSFIYIAVFLLETTTHDGLSLYKVIFFYGHRSVKLIVLKESYLATAQMGFAILIFLAFSLDYLIKGGNLTPQNQDEPPVRSRVGSGSEETSNVRTVIQVDSPPTCYCYY